MSWASGMGIIVYIWRSVNMYGPEDDKVLHC